jgi:hypothetical protein
MALSRFASTAPCWHRVAKILQDWHDIFPVIEILPVIISANVFWLTVSKSSWALPV